MNHLRPVAFLSILAAMSLLTAGRALAAGSLSGTPPKLQDILPDKPKPLANIISGMPSPEDQRKPAASRDPLGVLATDMGHVVTELDHTQTDQSVQAEQDHIVSNMDLLIKELEKSCCKSGSCNSASMNPTKPMSDSKLAGGPGGIHDLHDPRAGQRNWGDLPPKQRDQIVQSRTEGFPVGYENILQSYYFRLSQEQVGRDASGPATPPAQP